MQSFRNWCLLFVASWLLVQRLLKSNQFVTSLPLFSLTTSHPSTQISANAVLPISTKTHPLLRNEWVKKDKLPRVWKQIQWYRLNFFFEQTQETRTRAQASNNFQFSTRNCPEWKEASNCYRERRGLTFRLPLHVYMFEWFSQQPTLTFLHPCFAMSRLLTNSVTNRPWSLVYIQHDLCSLNSFSNSWYPASSSKRGYLNFEPGSEPGSEPGFEPGFEPGSEPGSEPRFEPGSERGSELGSEPGFKPGLELGS